MPAPKTYDELVRFHMDRGATQAEAEQTAKLQASDAAVLDAMEPKSDPFGAAAGPPIFNPMEFAGSTQRLRAAAEAAEKARWGGTRTDEQIRASADDVVLDAMVDPMGDRSPLMDEANRAQGGPDDSLTMAGVRAIGRKVIPNEPAIPGETDSGVRRDKRSAAQEAFDAIDGLNPLPAREALDRPLAEGESRSGLLNLGRRALGAVYDASALAGIEDVAKALVPGGEEGDILGMTPIGGARRAWENLDGIGADLDKAAGELAELGRPVPVSDLPGASIAAAPFLTVASVQPYELAPTSIAMDPEMKAGTDTVPRWMHDAAWLVYGETPIGNLDRKLASIAALNQDRKARMEQALDALDVSGDFAQASRQAAADPSRDPFEAVKGLRYQDLPVSARGTGDRPVGREHWSLGDLEDAGVKLDRAAITAAMGRFATTEDTTSGPGKRAVGRAMEEMSTFDIWQGGHAARRQTRLGYLFNVGGNVATQLLLEADLPNPVAASPIGAAGLGVYGLVTGDWDGARDMARAPNFRGVEQILTSESPLLTVARHRLGIDDYDPVYGPDSSFLGRVAADLQYMEGGALGSYLDVQSGVQAREGSAAGTLLKEGSVGDKSLRTLALGLDFLFPWEETVGMPAASAARRGAAGVKGARTASRVGQSAPVKAEGMARGFAAGSMPELYSAIRQKAKDSAWQRLGLPPDTDGYSAVFDATYATALAGLDRGESPLDVLPRAWQEQIDAVMRGAGAPADWRTTTDAAVRAQAQRNLDNLLRVTTEGTPQMQALRAAPDYRRVSGELDALVTDGKLDPVQRALALSFLEVAAQGATEAGRVDSPEAFFREMRWESSPDAPTVEDVLRGGGVVQPGEPEKARAAVAGDRVVLTLPDGREVNGRIEKINADGTRARVVHEGWSEGTATVRGGGGADMESRVVAQPAGQAVIVDLKTGLTDSNVTVDGLDGTGSAKARVLFQPDTPRAPTFYSAVARGLDRAFGVGTNNVAREMKASALLAQVKKQPGVKQEEIDWIGLEDFLAGKERVSLDEVQRFIAENQVRVEEVVRGDVAPEVDQAVAESRKAGEIAGRAIRRWEQATQGQGWITGPDGYRLRPRVGGEIEVRGPGDAYLTPREAGVYLTRPDVVAVLGDMDAEYRLVQEAVKADREASMKLADVHKRLSRPTEYDQYTHQGADPETYREMVLTLPAGEGVNYQSRHWSEPNVLAHVRIDETRRGKERILRVHEVQSDWHQEGRKKGYREDHTAEIAAAEERLAEAQAQKPPPELTEYDDRAVWYTQKADQIDKAQRELKALRDLQYQRGSLPPPAPFADSWHALAMKRLVRYAADNGFDRIVWPQGVDEAELFSLGGRVDEVRWQLDNVDDVTDGKLVAIGKDGQELGATSDWNGLDDAIGKEPAARLREAATRRLAYMHESADKPVRLTAEELDDLGLDPDSEKWVLYNVNGDQQMKPGTADPETFDSQQEAQEAASANLAENAQTEEFNYASISGPDLSIGTKGMAAFYDGVLVGWARKFGKPFGAVVEDVDLPAGEGRQTWHSMTVPEKMRETVVEQGLPLFQREDGPATPEIKVDQVRRAATLFSGGGLVELGMTGLVEPVAAVESDAKIADAYRTAHGDHVQAVPVQDMDVERLRGVEYLHASPVCKTSSKARALEIKEVPLDMETAQATVRALREARPEIFTLENVDRYANQAAFKEITSALTDLGYRWDAKVYDAADYGAPTYRRRLLLRAVREGHLPPPPDPTHGPGRARPFATWWDAVKDIAEDLPASELADWQVDRLRQDGIDPATITEPMLVMGGSVNATNVPWASANEPAPTIKATPRELHRIVLPGGRVLRVTPRAMARMTGIPDSYPLPESRIVATTIIGNGVPPALTRGVLAPLLEADRGASRARQAALFQVDDTPPLPPTLTIDGTTRPTTRADGRPIHPTREGVEAFWRWFGDSKVVDGEGRPLVVYHGTSHPRFDEFAVHIGVNAPVRRAAYFSDQASVANDAPVAFGPGAVYPVHLRMKNPLVLDGRGRHAIEMTEEVTAAQRPGHDGVILRNVVEFYGGNLGTTFAVLEPTQIKSATGNRGTFDPAEPSILLQRAAEPPTARDALRAMKRTSFVPDKAVVAILGDWPEYLDGVIEFMVGQREKLRAGTMTARDVAKAYFVTVASMGSDANGIEAVASLLGGEIDPVFLGTGAKGQPTIRPEEAAAAWLFTPMGQQALDAIEAGTFDAEAWAQGADVRKAFGDDRVRNMRVLSEPKKGGITLQNIQEAVDGINAAKGDPAKLDAVVRKLSGIGDAKAAFIKHLLGWGGEATADAVEINTWLTGRADIGRDRSAAAKVARLIKQFSNDARVSSEITERINRRIRGLRKSLNVDLPEDVFAHIVHHWLWDRAKGIETTHAGLYRAMRLAQPGPAFRVRGSFRVESRTPAGPQPAAFELVHDETGDVVGRVTTQAEADAAVQDDPALTYRPVDARGRPFRPSPLPPIVQAVLTVFRDGRFDTATHEAGHLLEEVMGPSWAPILAEQFASEDGALTVQGREQVANAFQWWIETKVAPTGAINRAFAEARMKMADLWLRVRHHLPADERRLVDRAARKQRPDFEVQDAQGASLGRFDTEQAATARAEATLGAVVVDRSEDVGLPPRVAVLWDSFFRPKALAQAYALTLGDPGLKGLPELEIPNDPVRAARQGQVLREGVAREGARVDATPDRVQQALGVRPGDRLSAADLLARSVAHVATENYRKAFTGTDLVRVTTRTVVPSSRVPRLRREANDAMTVAFGMSPADFIESGALIGDGETVRLSPAQQVGVRALANRVAAEPMGTMAVPRTLLQGDIATVRLDDLNRLQEVFIDTRAGVAARRSRAAEAVPASLGYALVRALGRSPESIHKIAVGAQEPNRLVQQVRQTFIVERPAGNYVDPGFLDLWENAGRKLGQAQLDVARHARGFVDPPGAGLTEKGRRWWARFTGQNPSMLETLQDFRRTLVPPVDPSRLGLRRTVRPKQLENSEAWAPRVDYGVDPDDDTTLLHWVERFSKDEPVPLAEIMQPRVLDAFSAILGDGPGIKDVEAEAIRSLRLSDPEDAEGALRIADAVSIIERGLNSRWAIVAEAARDIGIAVAGTTDANIWLNLGPDNARREYARVYAAFYTGRWEDLMGWAARKGQRTGMEEGFRLENYDMATAMVEMVTRLRAREILAGLAEDILAHGVTLDPDGLGKMGGVPANGEARSVFMDRVLHYLNNEVSWKQFAQKDEFGQVDMPPQPQDGFDQAAYDAAHQVLAQVGFRYGKGEWVRTRLPDGSEVLLPQMLKESLEDYLFRAADVGHAYGSAQAASVPLVGDIKRVTSSGGGVKLNPGASTMGQILGSSVDAIIRGFPLTPSKIRQGVTTGLGIPNVAYYTAAFLGGFLHAYAETGVSGLAAGTRNAPMVAAVMRRMSGGNYVQPSSRTLILPDGRVFTADMLAREFRNRGLHTGMIQAETARAMADELADLHGAHLRALSGGMAKWQDVLRQGATAVDNFHRIGVGIEALKEGRSLDEAAAIAREALLDYGRLTDKERQYGRFAMLFYSYMRRANDQLWYALLTNPSRVLGQLRLLYGLQRLHVDEEDPGLYLSENYEQRAVIAARKAARENALARRVAYLAPPIPVSDALMLYVDAFSAVQGDEAAIRGMAGLLAPWLQAPVVLATEAEPFSGRDLNSTTEVPPHLVEIDRMATGGMFVDGILAVRQSPDGDRPARYPITGTGAHFEADNEKMWWLTKNLGHGVPGLGRQVDLFATWDRANLGPVEAGVRVLRAAQPVADDMGWYDLLNEAAGRAHIGTPAARPQFTPQGMADTSGPRAGLGKWDERAGAFGFPPIIVPYQWQARDRVNARVRQQMEARTTELEEATGAAP